MSVSKMFTVDVYTTHDGKYGYETRFETDAIDSLQIVWTFYPDINVCVNVTPDEWQSLLRSDDSMLRVPIQNEECDRENSEVIISVFSG